ncbi:MAG TPA: hypothetical protein VH329_03650 [Solirubrobacterales bacterium]
MAQFGNKWARNCHRWSAAAALALIGVLVFSSSAIAGQDELKGGSVTLQLKNSRGLKLKPKSLNLPITGGALDPVDGSGTVQVAGGFKAKRGKGKVKVKITTFTLGPNGGPGSITAKVGKDFVSNFGKLSGGTVARSGWGATVTNVRATIGGRGAKALNAAFSPKKRKGAKKSAGGRVKAGQALGTIVSLTTEPRSVEVVPGSGQLVLTVSTDMSGTLFSKLFSHCIDPLPTGSPAGVSPIAPATADVIGTTYTFPVTGGSAAPDFSAGEVLTGGGQAITRNSSLNPLVPSACGSSSPPVGTQLTSTDIGVEFGLNLLKSLPTLPTGPTPRAPLGNIDFSGATRSVDPGTKTLNVTGAKVNLAALAAMILNQTFPNQSGDASKDFAGGDVVGTIDLTGVKLR